MAKEKQYLHELERVFVLRGRQSYNLYKMSLKLVMLKRLASLDDNGDVTNVDCRPCI